MNSRCCRGRNRSSQEVFPKSISKLNSTRRTGTFTYTYSGGGDRVLGLQLPGSRNLYITNCYDSLARLTNTWVNSPLLGTVYQHGYAYDLGSEVTQQVFTAGNFLGYTYDAIGQLKT